MYPRPVSQLVRTRLTLAIISGTAISMTVVAAEGPETKQRVDGAEAIPIALQGSLQNAAWSPDGTEIVFTRFRAGYNKSPADILVFDLPARIVRTLIEGNETNVSQPGSTWNGLTDHIVFSSTRPGHDEIFMIGSQGRSNTLRQLTSSVTHMSYEPSMSPDGRSVVFESHLADEETNGIIMRMTLDTSKIEELTRQDEDCRQPNWSPAGNAVIYQKKQEGQWDLWVYDIRRNDHRRLTEGEGDKTDATFSPDGRWVVYSADNANLREASLFVTNLRGGPIIQITDAGVYDGAPSWSPDGKQIVFESTAIPVRPGWKGWLERMLARFYRLIENEPRTHLWKIKVPKEILVQLCLAGSTCSEGG
jgi:TolB protein